MRGISDPPKDRLGENARRGSLSGVKGEINFDEQPGKPAGRRKPPPDPLRVEPGGRERAREWQRAFGSTGIPKGVYRFKTHQEADEWMWKMIARKD